MKDPNEIIIYNQLIQQNRLYQFLAGIDDTFDKDRRDLLLQDPLPTVEEAYASIRREIMRCGIMKREPSSDLESSSIGGGFTVKGRAYRHDDDKAHLKCTHCGGTRLTKNECFKLVGYREWWPDAKKKGAQGVNRFSDQNRTGKDAIGRSVNESSSMEREEGDLKTTENSTSIREREGRNPTPNGAGEIRLNGRGTKLSDLNPLNKGEGHVPPINKIHAFSSSLNISSYFESRWIFDCGATDTMSYDPNDFLTHDKPMKNVIKTANGEGIKVSGAGTISLTENHTLKNCLFVPELSHKLLSVCQLTRELDCIVLMKPSCCIVHDAQTRKIIGRGIERGGLYYLEEEIRKGNAVLVHGTEERQL